jgi:hypothetical protein
MSSWDDTVVKHLRGVASEQFNKNLIQAVTIINTREEAAREKVANDLQLEEVSNKLKRKADDIVDMEDVAKVRARDHERLRAQLARTEDMLEETTVRYFPPRVVQRC